MKTMPLRWNQLSILDLFCIMTAAAFIVWCVVAYIHNWGDVSYCFESFFPGAKR